MPASESSLAARDQQLTTSSLLSADRNESALGEFARSVAYTGLQSPVKALAQPIDRTFGTKVEETLTFIDAPKQAQFNSTRYWLQQTGNAVGMLGTFLVASKCARGITRAGMSEAQLAQHLTQRGALGLTLKEAALAGFMHDSILRPTDAKDTRSLLEARLASGATGALTMATLTASTIGLKSIGTADRLRSGLVSPLLRSDIFTGAVSGLGAGMVAANSESLLREGHLAKFDDMAKSAYTMSVLGGGFGAYHQFRGQHESGRSNFKWSDSPSPTRQFEIVGGERALSRALNQVDAGHAVRISVRENLGPATGWSRWFGGRNYGPRQQLLVQHRTAGNQLDASLVRTSDIVATCDLAPALRSQAVIDAGSIFLRAGRDRIAFSEHMPQTRAAERVPRTLGEPDLSGAPTELQAGLKHMAKKAEFRPVLDEMAAMGLDKLPNDVQLAIKIAKHLQPGDFDLVLSQFRAKVEKPTTPKVEKPVEHIPPEQLRQELVEIMEDASGRWTGYGYSIETVNRVVDTAHKILQEKLPGVHPEEVLVGSEQFAIVLSDKTVLKIQTNDTWLPEWGSRPFDLPLRKIGNSRTLVVGPNKDPWIVYRQPYADLLPDTVLVAKFEDLLQRHGAQFSDGGPIEASLSQLGLYKGQARLFDYPAVTP